MLDEAFGMPESLKVDSDFCVGLPLEDPQAPNLTALVLDGNRASQADACRNYRRHEACVRGVYDKSNGKGAVI
ncbi:hypothetical protein GGD66_002355 [Bradyrhizobium sp. CIR48]|uniref:hypothetical protein n=1 Tax=Bradyrhizobium sp. CIR48 TaxID=2663840 RepID=UPI001606A719|nr:hypothetical protein [Bradyrhizobium sp. CIR48]MBB4423811.1 hypothetical protein [Bradyrhizobium sp. CIR48]